ncbi:MAG: hypothetical protein MJ171_02630 [Clostridia bacterium]|nr:hypothetical protein [Clostridia bacterium]
MGTLIILGALLLASTPTIASVILCRKVDGTMWKWVLFGLLDSMFLMTVIVDPSVEPVLYLIGGISAELMGYYMNEKGRNGTVWFFLIASIFVVI